MFHGIDDAVTAHSEELDERAIAWVLPPINASTSADFRELNNPYPTLYAWRTRISKQAPPDCPDAELDEQFDSQSKVQVV